MDEERKEGKASPPAEKQIRGDERFRTIFELANDIIVYIDTHGTIVDVNKRVEEILGYRPEEITGKNFTKMGVFGLKDAPRILKRFRDAVESGGVGRADREDRYVTQLEVRHKNGREVPVEASTTSVREGGELKGFVSIIRDLTERKRTEGTLQQVRESYRSLFDNSPIGIYRTTPDGRILMASPALVRMLGYSSFEQLAARNLEEEGFEPSYPRSQFKEIMDSKGEVLGLEAAWMKKDGSVIFVRENAKAIRDQKGDILCYEGTVEDITESKGAEEALKRERDFSRCILQTANSLILCLDADGAITVFNDECERVTGYRREEILGKRWADLFLPPDKRHPGLKSFAGWVRAHPQNRYEGPVVTKSGEVRTILWSNSSIVGSEPSDVTAIAIGCDITERKRAEKVLGESEERFRRLYERAPLGYQSLDAEGCFIDVNQAWVDLFGYSRHQVIGHWFGDFLAPQEVEAFKRRFPRFIATGEVHVDVEMVQRAGSRIIVHIDGRISHDEHGEFKQTHCILHDITARKRTEQALRESEERHRTLFEGSLHPITIYDRDANIVMLNRVGAENLKRPLQEIIGKPLREFIPETHELTVKRVRQVLETGKPMFVEDEMPLPDGKRWFLSTLHPISDPRGQPDLVQVISYDITERKRAEEALRESERKYRDLVENINDVIYATDETGTLTYISPVIENIAGYKPSEVIGRNYLEFVHPEDKAAIVEGFEEIKTGKLSPSEYRVITKDNREVWIRTFSRPVFGEGRFVGLRGVMTDITERKRLFQQLIQSEKSAAVGTLAYGIAHEFNNILAGIMANAEYGLGIDDVKQVRECFKIIVENSQRGSSITNSLLAVAGEKERKRELADIRRPLENVLSFSLRELEKAGVRVIQDLKAVPEMFCDPGEFSEVFLNMINNARDAMTPGGGTLTVKIDHARDHIRIVFEDTGCGILEEIKDRIFDPFVTIKGALGKSEVPGTGLGLFVSRGIVDSYGGRIDVRSHPGKGTRFTITIPVTSNLPPESISREEIVSPKEIDTKLNILLIDDEKTICKVLKKFVESKGHQVTAFLEAEEGLKHFKEGKFDVVLSDITMPGMDGIELIKRIKEEDAHARIIAITGHVRQETLDRARKAGAQEILIKPFRSGELYDTILRLYQEAGQEGKTKGPAE